MFFKRLSRSRSNSQSYVDSYHSPHDSKTNSQSYDDKYGADQDPDVHQLPPGSRQSNLQSSAPGSASYQQQNFDVRSHGSLKKDVDSAANTGSNSNMYPRQSTSQEVGGGGGGSQHYPASPTMQRSGGVANGYARDGGSAAGTYDSMAKHEAAPDLLTQAFNLALKPHVEKVDALESEIADLRAYIDQLEAQRNEVHAWIDKRGLRPDVPATIAHQMDSSSHSSSPTHAASTLNAQLDRKITIVNFDLHRLQDDLNDSLPTPSFSACMLKFLPDISRLSALPSGSRYAFDLLLKLGGNLNSHGGLENGDEEDLAERRSFYARLDDSMVDVVRGRFRDEGDTWGVQREIKRIEKTGAYLRNWGVEPYFPRTLEVMREGSSSHSGVGDASSPTYN